jgi:diaminohydroxyphosphoribosylaminopyrimidine deaminase/5-amino-6-(5-phosphoribosylamino)uracil reductase
MSANRLAIMRPVSDDLMRPLREASPAQPFVIAQLGQSLDGRIATECGDSKYINGPAALDHLHRLRANIDAVVVGVGTAIADDPALTVRRVKGRNPARVVIDPSGRLPAGARCLADDGVQRIIVREPGRIASGSATVMDLPRQGELISPGRIISSLFGLGLKRILIEGGSRTLSAFFQAGAVDRLHVMVAPIILGSGVPGFSLPAIERLSHACRPQTSVHVLDDGNVLFDCNLRIKEQG